MSTTAFVDEASPLVSKTLTVHPSDMIQLNEYPARSPLPRQTPFSITLDGPKLVVTSIGLVVLSRPLDVWLAGLIVCLISFALYVLHDYHNFLDLGPGGTPSTPIGYLKISYFRLWALRDPYQPPKSRTDLIPNKGLLPGRGGLPRRVGPRPRTAGIAPHRQLDQRGSEACFRALRQAMRRLGDDVPSDFRTGLSLIEKRGLGLFARYAIPQTGHGEICHVHDTDYALHMALHPDDVKEVLDKGWGQRHPLAQAPGWIKMPVSQYFTLIYAPRDENELQAVCTIIEAGIWYNTGEERRFPRQL